MNMGGTEPGRNGFEQRLKESIDQYEVPYNSADWAQMERALSSGVRGWGHGRSLVVGALIAGALLIGGTAYFLGRDTNPTTAANPTVVVRQSGNPSVITGTQEPQIASPEQDLSSTFPAASSSPAITAIPETPQHTEKPVRTNRSSKAAVNVNGAVAVAAPKPDETANSTSVFHASAKEACPGTPVKFTVEHMPDDGIYLWNFGDGSFSNKPDPEHTYTKAGSYEVMLSLSSSGAGTIHNKPSSGVIVVHDGPVAAFNVLQQDAPGMIPSMRFENTSKSADTYTWSFGDGTTSTAALPDHIFKKKGAYRIELTATSAEGCLDRTMKEIHVDRDHDLGAPTSFAPKSEGQGDVFMPAALTHLRTKFQLAVYDSAGLLLYSTTDAKQPWNGRVNNQDALCAAGNYVWVVDLDEGQQSAETFTGQVKLER